MDGKSRNTVDKLKAGDLGCTLKLKNTLTNHTLCGKGIAINIEPIQFPEPKTRVALIAKTKVMKKN